MMNKNTLVRDPSSYRLADGGVAKVYFPPDEQQKAILREQLETFVCKGAYADGLRGILEAFNAAAGKSADTPAAWVSGFFGSGKSLLVAMLAALWINLKFEDGATAEGLVHDMPSDVKAALRELRTKANQMGGGLVVGGGTLGLGSQNAVKAVLEIVFRAVGLPTSSDLRPTLLALWLAEQGMLEKVQATLGVDFPRALSEFLLDDRFASAVLAANPALARDTDVLMDRLTTQFGNEPEPTVAMLLDVAQRALTRGGRQVPLTLIILDEVQQFLRENPSDALVIDTIVREMTAKFRGRVLIVATGQNALGDVPYLQKLFAPFTIKVPLTSADIDSVIRETILLKKDTAKPDLARMLELRSGEIDKHLAGSTLKRTEADRANAVADWPMLSTRRKLWERVLSELDKSGLGSTLRGQLRLTLDAVQTYGDRELGVAVPADFLFDSFANEALSRQLISREVYDRISDLRSQAGDGPLKARVLIIVYLLSRIAGDASIHGVHATPEVIADLLIDDLGNTASIRGKVPELLNALYAETAVIQIGDEWRLQTKESADWQAAYDRAYAREVADVEGGVARQRAALLGGEIENALAGAVQVTHGEAAVGRRIERVDGDTKPSGDGVVLRIWNGWDKSIPATLAEIRGADVQTDATLHFVIPDVRAQDLKNAIMAFRAATSVIQTQGVPASEGGKEAKAAMQSRFERAHSAATEILREAVGKAQVFLAGGDEVVPGAPRSDAVKQAALRALARLYPKFSDADHKGWGKALAKTRQKLPDALTEVSHPGEPQDHQVAKEILRHLGGGKKGVDIRNHFMGSPFGWPKDAVDTVLVALANAGQIKVANAEGKPVVLAEHNTNAYGAFSFTPETRVVSVKEKMAVRAIGVLVELTVPAGDEVSYLLPIVDRITTLATEGGGAAPAPKSPEVPDIAKIRASTGNDLLAVLAGQYDVLKSLIPQWQAAKREIAKRLKDWELARKLVHLGANGQQAALDAIQTGRTLLAEPNSLPSLVKDAADDLRIKVQEAYSSWKTAWDAGEAKLDGDFAWAKIGPDKKRELRVEHGLLFHEAPDVSDPHQVANSLTARALSEWKNMTIALPVRVDAALRDAATEVEPKTQNVTLSWRTLHSVAELDAWLSETRERITARLDAGPVRPAL